MKTIRISHPHSFEKENFPNTVLALGFFDGVHKGHQEVIQTARSIAEEKGMKSAVMTFDPHPSVVLSGYQKKVEYITPLEDKEILISEQGIDFLYIIEFSNDFANLLPQEFVDQYILELNVKHVVAGYDFSYGKLGKGTMETLPFHSRNQFTQTTIEKLTSNEDKISSTLIRQLISKGEVEKLPSLLGRFYSVSGKVVDGEKRGRTIGFPTANVQLNKNYMYPLNGVYAVKLKVNSTWYIGVCNVGVKPTFHENQTFSTIEVHIVNFNNMIYGENVEIKWCKRIRPEMKFSGIEELVEQIERDKQATLDHFEKIGEQTCFLS